MKKWLSRAVVLAMIVAMMVPMPVAAKSSNGGGKLVASVTYYDVDGSGQGWEMASKTSYKYGKSNMPAEVTRTSYTTYLGVPVSGSSYTYKNKITKKSEKTYDTAGFVAGKKALKNGKVINWSSENKWSEKRKKADGTVYDWASTSASVGHASYFKNGLMKAEDKTDAGLDSDNDKYQATTNAVYAWNQKKGVPSLMYRTAVESGNRYVWVWNEETGEETREEIKYTGEAETTYAIFNNKGLVIEEGTVKDGKNVPDTAIIYTMKKGKVDTAVIYDVEEGKPTPRRMLKFKYTKKSISKTYNLRMMNDILDCDGFIWY